MCIRLLRISAGTAISIQSTTRRISLRPFLLFLLRLPSPTKRRREAEGCGEGCAGTIQQKPRSHSLLFFLPPPRSPSVQQQTRGTRPTSRNARRRQRIFRLRFFFTKVLVKTIELFRRISVSSWRPFFPFLFPPLPPRFARLHARHAFASPLPPPPFLCISAAVWYC